MLGSARWIGMVGVLAATGAGCSAASAGTTAGSGGGGAAAASDAGSDADAASPSPEPMLDGGFASSASAGVGGSGGGASCAPCAVTEPGEFCGMTVGVDPFVVGGPFGGFQSDEGTGASSTITITLSSPINWVSVKILDPDYAGNVIRTYDAASNLISEMAFSSDGIANVFTENMQGLGGQGIVKVELVPAPADYVAYDDLTIVPSGCAGPQPK